MVELTDQQKEDCQKIMNSLINYWYEKLAIKMETVSFDTAMEEIMEEITDA